MANSRKNVAWRDYQEKAAELFRSMGFEAVVEEVLDGARGKHKVDVVARSKLGGLAVTWIVECKHWKSAVPKAHVLTLAQIAQDIGADRAVLLSEKGFQAGAVFVSRKSNVLLTSLAELQSTAAESIADAAIRQTLSAVKGFERQLREIFSEYGLCVPPPPELEETITLLGACLEITLVVIAAQMGQFPVRLPSMLSDKARVADDLPTVAEALTFTAGQIADRYAVLKTAIREALDPYLQRSEELACLVHHLMARGAMLLEPVSDNAVEEVKLQEIVASMRAVGDCAETLRSAPSVALSGAVHALMQELIDGAYLWFANPHRTQNAWIDVVHRTDEAILRLADVATKVNS